MFFIYFLLKTRKKHLKRQCFRLLFKAGRHANACWLQFKMNKKGWKGKKSFQGASNNRKLVKIHNTCRWCFSMTFILTLAAYHFTYLSHFSLSLCFCDSWSLGFSLSVHVFFVRLFVWLSFCQSLYAVYEKAIRPVRLPSKFFSVCDPSFQIQFSAKLFC